MVEEEPAHRRERPRKPIEKIGVEQLKIRSVLTCETKRGMLREVLRRQPRDRPDGQDRRSRRHHRRAVHRRARHAAHDAYLPHRWRRVRQTFKQPIIKAKNDGDVTLQRASASCRALDGKWIVLNKNGYDHDPRQGRPRTRALQHRRRLRHRTSPTAARSKKGEAFAQWDPYNVPILTEKAGKVEFRDMIRASP